MQMEPLFFFGIAQKPKGFKPFESYLFLYNMGEAPIRDVTITKKGEFYYLLNEMKIASELGLNSGPWWKVRVIPPHQRKMKKTKGLEVRHLPEKGTVLAEQDLPSREPTRFIVWLELTYMEAAERKIERLLCALEPDGVNLLPILTSEDPYQVISKRLKELDAG